MPLPYPNSVLGACITSPVNDPTSWSFPPIATHGRAEPVAAEVGALDVNPNPNLVSTALLARLGTALASADAPGGGSWGGDGAAGLCWAIDSVAPALGPGLAALVRALAGPTLQLHRPALAQPLPLQAAGASPSLSGSGLGSGPEPGAGAGERVWEEYECGEQFARGSFGEVWRGLRRSRARAETLHAGPLEAEIAGVPAGSRQQGPAVPEEGGKPTGSGERGPEEGAEQGGFVLKRILGGPGSDAWLSGRREEHFGRLFWPAQARAAAGLGSSGAGHVVRFVEALEVRSPLGSPTGAPLATLAPLDSQKVAPLASSRDHGLLAHCS